MSSRFLIDDVNAILPQTQCTKCGYEGCLPYAQAIVLEQAPINRCPPGGAKGIAQLAQLLERPIEVLDPSCGVEKPLHKAVIDEKHCIGCTLCIRACPVDAIVGVNKFMHTVVADLCTGCELCVAPCPVDCISMQATPDGIEWTITDRQAARWRYEQRQKRQDQKAQQVHEISTQQTQLDVKQDLIAKALAKARARRQTTTN